MQLLALPGFLAFFVVSMWVGDPPAAALEPHAPVAGTADGYRRARHRSARLRHRDGRLPLVAVLAGLARFLVAIAVDHVAAGVAREVRSSTG